MAELAKTSVSTDKMEKNDLIVALSAIGYKYAEIMGKRNIVMIFNYINFLALNDFDDVSPNPAILQILETYEI